VMNFVAFPLRQGRCGCSLVVVVILPQVLWFANSVQSCSAQNWRWILFFFAYRECSFKSMHCGWFI
jgi:hypothetical protein